MGKEKIMEHPFDLVFVITISIVWSFIIYNLSNSNWTAEKFHKFMKSGRINKIVKKVFK